MTLLTSRRDRALASQLPEIASDLARLIDSGSTLYLALCELASSYPAPAGGELATVVRDIDNGMLVDDALASWVVRSARTDVKLLASACRLGVAHGGNLVSALEGVSSTLIDSLELGEETRSLTTQSRTSAHVLIALPVAGLGLFTMVDSSVASFLFGTAPGLVLLAVGVILDLLGALCMASLVRWALR